MYNPTQFRKRLLIILVLSIISIALITGAIAYQGASNRLTFSTTLLTVTGCTDTINSILQKMNLFYLAGFIVAVIGAACGIIMIIVVGVGLCKAKEGGQAYLDKGYLGSQNTAINVTQNNLLTVEDQNKSNINSNPNVIPLNSNNTGVADFTNNTNNVNSLSGVNNINGFNNGSVNGTINNTINQNAPNANSLINPAIPNQPLANINTARNQTTMLNQPPQALTQPPPLQAQPQAPTLAQAQPPPLTHLQYPQYFTTCKFILGSILYLVAFLSFLAYAGLMFTVLVPLAMCSGLVIIALVVMAVLGLLAALGMLICFILWQFQRCKFRDHSNNNTQGDNLNQNPTNPANSTNINNNPNNLNNTDPNNNPNDNSNNPNLNNNNVVGQNPNQNNPNGQYNSRGSKASKDKTSNYPYKNNRNTNHYDPEFDTFDVNKTKINGHQNKNDPNKNPEGKSKQSNNTPKFVLDQQNPQGSNKNQNNKEPGRHKQKEKGSQMDKDETRSNNDKPKDKEKERDREREKEKQKQKDQNGKIIKNKQRQKDNKSSNNDQQKQSQAKQTRNQALKGSNGRPYFRSPNKSKMNEPYQDFYNYSAKKEQQIPNYHRSPLQKYDKDDYNSKNSKTGSNSNLNKNKSLLAEPTAVLESQQQQQRQKKQNQKLKNYNPYNHRNPYYYQNPPANENEQNVNSNPNQLNNQLKSDNKRQIKNQLKKPPSQSQNSPEKKKNKKTGLLIDFLRSKYSD